MSRSVAVGLLATALSIASAAHAHESPTGLVLAWPSPASNAPPVVLTNRGLIFPTGSEPEAPFALRCNEAYRVTTGALPNLVLDPEGALVLQTTRGVSITSDRGCGFASASGLPDLPLGGFAQDPTSPNKLLVTTQDYETESRTFASEDYGHTWTPRATNAPTSVYDKLVMGDDGRRVYAAGARYDRVTRALIPTWASSRDAGRSFRDQDVPAARIPLGVHPRAPDTVFARETSSMGISEVRDKLVRSTDGGESFTTVLDPKSVLSSFAASPDGRHIWVGSETAGLYASSDGGESFTRLAADDILSVRCLHYRQGVLWVCANRHPNTHGVWSSADDGATWTEALTFSRVTSQVSCPSVAKNVCATPWLDWERELLSEPKAVDAGAGSGPAIVIHDEGEPDADAGAKPQRDGEVDDAPEAAPADAGGCGVGEADDGFEIALGLLGLGLLRQRRRKPR